jgi:lincosamide nucleotidyltransferase A/C/D/E
MLPAEDAAALCKQLEEHGIRFWVMGGWGVDALLRRQTRPHKDLDILVLLGDLPKLRQLLTEHGFTLKRVWQESRPLGEEADRWPSAFVVADTRGREIDAHVIDIGPDGRIVQHYDDPWPLPDSIAGQGSIAGTDVTCVSKETQLAMHTGYSLPDGHLRDIALLRAD